MRQFIWAGVAAVVVSVTAVYLAADHAARNPDSWFGRCISMAAYVGGKCNPFAGLSAAAARRATSDAPPPVCQAVEEPNADAEPGEQPVPAEAEEASEPIELRPQPAFIMPFEPDETPAVPASEETPEPRFGAGEESEVPPAVDAPAAQEQKAEPAAKGCNGKGYFSWFMGFFGSKGCGKCCEHQEAVTGDREAEQQETPPMAEEAGNSKELLEYWRSLRSSHEQVPDCREDPSYHQQYPGCPYTGCPCPDSPMPAMSTPVDSTTGKPLPIKKPVKTPAPVAPPKAPKQSSGEVEQATPRPDVDTMEARPTDLEKDPFAGAPF
jgi:hypothetical protein